MAYRVQRAPRHFQYTLRGLNFHLYEWPGDGPLWVLLHGWGDSAATFQFLVDHLRAPRQVLAPDLRGFGRTQWAADGYWFPDYLADLDALLDQHAPRTPVFLVGHSMGGNIAMLYAGIRPHRVRAVVSLEGFGLAQADAAQTPAHYARWLDQVNAVQSFTRYRDFDQFVALLARRNPRTPPAQLEFIARAWGRECEDGSIELRADPAHKRVNPVLYQRDQALACWRQIVAPVLWVSGGQSAIAHQAIETGMLEQVRQVVPQVQLQTIAAAGHMMHHEEPQAVAALVEAFSVAHH